MNDRITAVNGVEIPDGGKLKIEIGRHIQGDTVKLTVKRGDDEKQFDVKLGALPARVNIKPARE